jgi:P27 family predicted phage terminase small subunit
MGRRGPPKKPTALVKLAGNPGHRPLPKNEPDPPPASLTPPAWVQGEAKKIWDEAIVPLVASKLARSVDVLVLARYCVLFAEWLRARDAIQVSAVYPIKDADGNVVRIAERPESSNLRKLNRELLIIEREFGQTPAARTRIQVANDQTSKTDPIAVRDRLSAGVAPAAAPKFGLALVRAPA